MSNAARQFNSCFINHVYYLSTKSYFEKIHPPALIIGKWWLCWPSQTTIYIAEYNKLSYLKETNYHWYNLKFDVHRAVHRNIISVVKNQPDAPMYQILFYFGMTLYMFRMVFPSIISSSRLYIQLSNRYCCLPASKHTAVSFWQMLVAVCTVLNCWWWTERPSETCRVSYQHKINLIHWCI